MHSRRNEDKEGKKNRNKRKAPRMANGDTTGQDRIGQDRTGQDRTRQDTTGH